MGLFTRQDDLIVRKQELIGLRGRSCAVQLLTTEEVRKRLGFAHPRHIYWLVEQGYLPLRKFGRELVFTDVDVEDFMRNRGR